MKAIIFGAVLGLLLWPASLSLTAATAAALVEQPTVLTFALGVLVGPGLGHRVRGWTR